MHTGAIVVFTCALLLVVGGGFDSVEAQSPPAEGAVLVPIGKVVTSTGAVTIEHGGGAVVLQANINGAVQTKVGDPVYKGDVVSTGGDGRVGIVFSDGTAFNVSSNARMVLNEFVYDPKGSSNSSLISLTKGTFTFIAGKVAKTGDMKVDTPVATMGIRGTTPHVEIRDNGSVAFSTLIEDKKAIEKLGSPKRHARTIPATPSPTVPTTSSSVADTNVPPAATGSIRVQESETKSDAKSKRGLKGSFEIKICKDC
jgi:hypothetical protein